MAELGQVVITIASSSADVLVPILDTLDLQKCQTSFDQETDII